MSFPASYSLYQEVTIDHTKVSADLTDYVVYVNLADLVKAGADIFDTCRSDGGDIRATKSDGTTQLATELVAIDTTAKTGELHVKFAGTLSSSTDTIIRIWYNGTDTALAVSDTYGRNAVWSGYKAVYHLDSLTLDSTGNSYTLTNVGTATNTTVEIDNGVDLGTTNTSKCLNMGSFPWGSFSTSKSVSFYIRMNTELSASPGWAQMISAEKRDGTAKQFYHFLYEYNGGTRRVRFGRYSNSGVWCDYNITMGTSSIHRFMWKWDSSDSYSRLYYNGANVVNTLDNATALSGGATFNNTAIGRYTDSNNPALGYISADFDEVRFADVAFSADWETTEYNNQNSPSTFYSAGSEQGGGGGGYTPTPILHMLQMSGGLI